ncbi:MAG: enoyl-CoA hydratase/isomerase family protein [Oleiphilaceae bacterium]|nr:enoyl-CoA hydratase/isomerase family protein [Oleiphilaceae bacterium]
MTNQTVVFDELTVADGGRIGVARLNAPRSLNALSLDMIHALKSRLDDWSQDDGVKAVWLEGEGDKAFCAGGDIVALYRAMTEPRQDNRGKGAGEQFFTDEYDLDYRIHTYPKPIIVWGNGVVMGGGVGLMAGGSHRVVTENSKLAMPEVSIGMYPDVGAGWFFNRMPGRTGLFLGLTGARMNAADALFVGLADRFIRHEYKAEIMAALQKSDLGESASGAINKVLRHFEHESRAALPASPVQDNFELIQKLTDADSLDETVDNLHRLGESDPWLAKSAQTVAAASPTAMAIQWRHFHDTARDSLAEVFDKELVISLRCLERGEFAEGVRALLIDKDQQPRWHYSSLTGLDPAWVESFFGNPELTDKEKE